MLRIAREVVSIVTIPQTKLRNELVGWARCVVGKVQGRLDNKTRQDQLDDITFFSVRYHLFSFGMVVSTHICISTHRHVYYIDIFSFPLNISL